MSIYQNPSLASLAYKKQLEPQLVYEPGLSYFSTFQIERAVLVLFFDRVFLDPRLRA